MRLWLYGLGCLLLIVACSETPPTPTLVVVIVTATVAPATSTAVPPQATYTPYPTYTALPTYTPPPTYTAPPTSTERPTPKPAPTTAVPVPPTAAARPTAKPVALCTKAENSYIDQVNELANNVSAAENIIYANADYQLNDIQVNPVKYKAYESGVATLVNLAAQGYGLHAPAEWRAVDAPMQKAMAQYNNLDDIFSRQMYPTWLSKGDAYLAQAIGQLQALVNAKCP